MPNIDQTVARAPLSFALFIVPKAGGNARQGSSINSLRSALTSFATGPGLARKRAKQSYEEARNVSQGLGDPFRRQQFDPQASYTKANITNCVTHVLTPKCYPCAGQYKNRLQDAILPHTDSGAATKCTLQAEARPTFPARIFAACEENSFE